MNPAVTEIQIVPTPSLKFDAQGHAIPRTEAEHQAIVEAFQLALEIMSAIPDDPEGSDQEAMRAIDEGRPERPLFQEYY